MAQHFDYIILGAGAAGLSLAYYMAQYPALQQSRVLIIDKADKNHNDRTWTFWGDPPADLAHLVHKSWHSLILRDRDQTVEAPIHHLPYRYIPGDAFYGFTKQAIDAQPSYQFLKATIEEVDTAKPRPEVTADGVTFTADYVFNSAFPGTSNLHEIQDEIAFQRFRGWEVEFETPILDPDQLTLMDFSLNPADDLRFIYVLPLSPQRLIINCTAFGQTPISLDFYEDQMHRYLRSQITDQHYRIVRYEGGMIPMSHLPLQRYHGKRVINLGILGGDTRASTGYTFIHAVQNAQALAGQLAEGQAPVAEAHKPRHAFYDRIFLHVLAAQPKALEAGLMALFQRNSAKQVFRFLSGQTTLREEIPLILSLPIRPFVQGLANMLKKPETTYATAHRLSKARD